MSFMSKFSNALVNMTKDVPVEEVHVAIGAASTSFGSIITGDPLSSGLIQLGVSCCFKSQRNAGNFAGIGAATVMGLAFGPIGGTLVTAGLLLANRVMETAKDDLRETISEIKFARPKQSAYAQH